ncbi:MAG TPA: hypothetical protein VIL28_06475, partial [Steroidobacteraceae bacterium]
MSTKRMKATSVALLGGLLIATAFAADEFLGSWTGTWEGAGSGGNFNITLTNDGGKLGGKVDVGQDTGDYSATF